jgi:hypothetical protein
LKQAHQEEIPDQISEPLRLRVGREARGARRASKADRHNLALRNVKFSLRFRESRYEAVYLALARLDIRRKEAAVRQVAAGEDRVVGITAGLMCLSANGVLNRQRKLTLAKFTSGRPPGPKKTSKNASGKASIPSS